MTYNPPLNPWPPLKPPSDWTEFSWDNPDTWDPTVARDRHPLLPCGLNSAAWNADEINGAGVEEPLWPAPFKATQTYRPSVVDATDFDVFDCVDLSIQAVNGVIAIPAENDLITVKGRSCHRHS